MVTKSYPYLGRHAIFDIELDKYHKYLCDSDSFFQKMYAAVTAVGGTVLNTQLHCFEGKNSGYTFTIILAESHASCHTWPEHGVATFDIFMCGKCNPFEAQKLFLNSVEFDSTKKIFETTLYRGFYKSDPQE